MSRMPVRLSFTLLLLLPALANAHPGHGAVDFAAGLGHPLTGLDHLLAMLAVGWWSAAVQIRRWWQAPAAFASCTLLGALVGLVSVPVPALEAAIALSLLVLGTLMLRQQRLPAGLAVALLGGCGLLHGYAHGQELPVSSQAAAWLCGMVAATLGLHLVGACAGALARRMPWFTRAAGAGIGLAGAALLFGVVGA